jgi:TolB protein
MRVRGLLLFLLLCIPILADVALAQPQPAPTTPDESVLGTVEVNGSAGALPPPPKLGVVPVITSSNADTLLQLVTRRDLELSGQFEVLDVKDSPPGPFLRDTPVDLYAWKQKKAEYVVRVLTTPKGGKLELSAEAFVVPDKMESPDAGDAGAPEAAKPNYQRSIESTGTDLRASAHKLVDLLLGGLTGRPGGFSSEMTYVSRVGKWRQVMLLDSDGFNLHAYGPSNATALSPSFGPNGVIFYAWSQNFEPFRVAFGPQAAFVPMHVEGSVLGFAFSGDRAKVALTVMDEGKSDLYTGTWGDLRKMSTPPYANHPAFGPMGKVAYVAGLGQRVYVDGKAISPPGFMAAAPVFCDTPQGLLVIFGVGVGAGADLIAMDPGGGSIRRLTQNQGANTYAACSPDGRLVAFFSNAKGGKGPGLYILPIQRPWLQKKISDDVGEFLRWEPIGAWPPT